MNILNTLEKCLDFAQCSNYLFLIYKYFVFHVGNLNHLYNLDRYISSFDQLNFVLFFFFFLVKDRNKLGQNYIYSGWYLQY